MFSSDAARRRIGAGDTVHLTNRGEAGWYGFASEILALERARSAAKVPQLIAIKTSEFPTQARRPMNSRLSTEKARAVWNLQVTDWRESLADCLDQLR